MPAFRTGFFNAISTCSDQRFTGHPHTGLCFWGCGSHTVDYLPFNYKSWGLLTPLKNVILFIQTGPLDVCKNVYCLKPPVFVCASLLRSLSFILNVFKTTLWLGSVKNVLSNKILIYLLSNHTCKPFKIIFQALDSEVMWFYFPLTLFSLHIILGSLCKSCTCTCEFVSQSGVIIIQWSVCAEHFVPFSYKINSRRLSILQGACRSSWGRFTKKRLKMLSHSEPLENCN